MGWVGRIGSGNVDGGAVVGWLKRTAVDGEQRRPAGEDDDCVVEPGIVGGCSGLAVDAEAGRGLAGRWECYYVGTGSDFEVGTTL